MNTIPILQITGKSICMYQEILNRSDRSTEQRESESNLKNITYNGYMSPKTKSKVRKYLEVWLNGVQNNMTQAKKRFKNKSIYPTFVTLTLSSKQVHTDNQLKRELLNQFIIWVKQSHKVVYYYWRAEPQKNGNIHFHLIIDRYIPHLELRNTWNRLQDKLGYIKPYTDKMKLLSLNQYISEVKYYKGYSFEKAKSHYLENKKKGWISPNSTDIHRIKNLRSLSAYVIKYMTKTDGSRKIEGRIHGGADILRQLRAYSDTMGQNAYGLISALEKEVGMKKKEGEYFTVYYLNTMAYLKKNAFNIYSRVQSYYNAQFDSIYDINNIGKDREEPTPILEVAIAQAVTKKREQKVLQMSLFA